MKFVVDFINDTCENLGTENIDNHDRGKVNVVGSRDGETRGMLATIVPVLTHWLLTNFCHRHIASTAGSDTCECCIMLACTHLLATKVRQRNEAMRRVRAHCTNCEICAGNRCLVRTLAYVGILLLSSSLYLCLSLPPSPARRGESWLWSQMRALTLIIASNALAAGV